MAGPVTHSIPGWGEMRPVWPYAVALGTSTKRVVRELEAHGIPIVWVAGTPMASVPLVEALMRDLAAAAEAAAVARATRVSRVKEERNKSELEFHLERQANEMLELRTKVEALQHMQGGDQ